MRPIVNLDELDFSREIKKGTRYGARIAAVAPRVGGKLLGYNVTVVEPGKRAFPFHCHHANEEMFFVLQGSGTLRYGAEEFAVRAGDFIACPPGGKDTAHQLINTGSDDLRYLAVSTAIGTEVCEYPDSGKFAATGGRVPGMRMADAPFTTVCESSSAVDYYHGEEV
jgi:uncharacterized cupin superfamily protein